MILFRNLCIYAYNKNAQSKFTIIKQKAPFHDLPDTGVLQKHAPLCHAGDQIERQF